MVKYEIKAVAISKLILISLLILSLSSTKNAFCKTGNSKIQVVVNYSVFSEHQVEPDTTETVILRKQIDAFWDKTKAQLALIPINAKIEKVNEPLAYQKYLITVQSLNNVTVAGFLSIPVQGEGGAKPWPVLVTACGYSGRGQGVDLNECQRGYAVLQVYPRGQGESEKYFKLKGDKVSTNLVTPEGAYYQGGYSDVMRMIDYVITRKDIDPNRIAMVATSQGGGIALAVAALDSRVKAVVAHLPFLCNFRLASTMKSLVKIVLDKSGTNNESSLKTLDFFDPFQLAYKITVPVLLSAGGKDQFCPQATVESVYERLGGKKSIEVYPNLTHTSCNGSYNLQWQWLDQNFRNK
jgi:cephalosporin-C deacetylase